MIKKKHHAKQCLSSAFQLAQAIKQYKTILDPVGSATTYYLQGRKVDLQASLSLLLSLLKTSGASHEGP